MSGKFYLRAHKLCIHVSPIKFHYGDYNIFTCRECLYVLVCLPFAKATLLLPCACIAVINIHFTLRPYSRAWSLHDRFWHEQVSNITPYFDLSCSFTILNCIAVCTILWSRLLYFICVRFSINCQRCVCECSPMHDDAGVSSLVAIAPFGRLVGARFTSPRLYLC